MSPRDDYTRPDVDPWWEALMTPANDPEQLAFGDEDES